MKGCHKSARVTTTATGYAKITVLPVSHCAPV